MGDKRQSSHSETLDHGTGQFNEKCIQESLDEALGTAHDNASVGEALEVEWMAQHSWAKT
jgi:hypothetical protein